MKNVIEIVCFLFIVIILISCSKNDGNNNSIVGNWQIINDSSSITNSLNGFNAQSNYIGMSGDFYNFKPDGKLYLREGNSVDTGKYSMIAGDKIQIIMYSENGISFGTNGAIRGNFSITNLTSGTLTLTLSQLTPEGYEFEMINFKK